MSRMRLSRRPFPMVATWCVLLLAFPALCENTTDHVPATQQLLVRYRPEVTSRNGVALDRALSPHVVSDLHVVQVPVGDDSAGMLRELRSRPEVLYAEPNYVRRVSAILP